MLLFVAVFFAAIETGGTFVGAYSTRPTLRRLPSDIGLDIHQKTTHRIEQFMPIAFAIAFGSAVAALVLDHEGTEAVFIAIAVACGLVITVRLALMLPGFACLVLAAQFAGT